MCSNNFPFMMCGPKKLQCLRAFSKSRNILFHREHSIKLDVNGDLEKDTQSRVNENFNSSRFLLVLAGRPDDSWPMVKAVKEPRTHLPPICKQKTRF